MKLQRTFICIAGVFFAIGFAASQAAAGTGTPGCSAEGIPGMEIEINALRAGGKTIVTSPNDTTKVTAKARILKGTALPGTTLFTTLAIEAITGGDVIGTASTAQNAITLGVGKGGKGASLVVDTAECSGGLITFSATFAGVDEDNDICTKTRVLHKACR
jgi:lipoprotein-anchoring transpeptidase ErfK/SrfK